MKYSGCVFLICIMIGCAVKSSNESPKSDSSLQIDKSFEDFFKEFSSSSEFQASRIKFPLKHSYYDEDEESLTDGEIKAGEWKFIDFRNDSLASTKKEDAFGIEILKRDLNAVEYLRKGIDNGISMSYHFEKDGTRWFLTEIVDRSN